MISGINLQVQDAQMYDYLIFHPRCTLYDESRQSVINQRSKISLEIRKTLGMDKADKIIPGCAQEIRHEVPYMKFVKLLENHVEIGII